jgi:hypothetical protein
MSERKKGGLGAIAAKPPLDDPLDALFGGTAKAEKPEKKQAARQSAPTAPVAASNAKPAAERILKSFRIDRELAINLKVYAAKNGTSGDRVIEAALRKFLADETG